MMSHAPRLPLQVAFLTGQSNPPGAALTPVQVDFLARLPVPAEARVGLNFPYPTVDVTATASPASLLAASVRNGRQYLASRRAGFAERHRPAVAALLARADHTLLLAGSCGLELFNNLALPVEMLRRVTIFAYGPVARRRPDCACVLVQGRRDWLSRWYFQSVDARVNAGHLGYLSDPAVLALTVETVRRLNAQTGAPAAR